MNKALLAILIIIVLAAGGVGGYFLYKSTKKEPAVIDSQVNKKNNTNSTNTTAKKQTIKLYLVATDDKGKSGKEIGCGDSLVAVDKEISETKAVLKASMEELLAIKTHYFGQSGLYNALYQSNLKLDSAEVKTDGTAIVNLSGSLVLGGTCDAPRIQAQLEETAKQFLTVKSVKININGKELSEALSQK